MGTLRTLLAIAVVFAHSYGFVFVGGRNAVQIFYMMSGFLISYVIVERKAYSNTLSFYVNRYLRLYPIYFAVTLLTLLVFSIELLGFNKRVELFDVYLNAPLTANVFLAFSNLLLFLQDWVMFAGVEHNQLVFSRNFFNSDVILYKGLLVPQAWTLGVELSFYLIAPLVLPRRKLLLTLLLISLALRAFLLFIGLGGQDPWTYRFFPTELALFLLGAISHQVLLPFYRNFFSKENIARYSAFSTYFLILVTILYWLIPINDVARTLVLLALFFLLMPFTFTFQSRNSWDKWVGELSYPIYICHMLMIYITSLFLRKININDTMISSLTAVTTSILFSIILIIYIGNPVEALRHRYKTNI